MNRMSVFHILCLVSHLLHVAVFAQETGRKQVLQLGSKTDAKPIYNTETKTEGFLSPQQSLEALKLPEGFSATLFAAEPDIQQPIAATTDAKGRLWVCENYTYSESKVNFDLSLRDRIVILEDKDGDGKFDERTVFWDQGVRLTSVEIGFDGVYVLCAPQLLFIPDRNHDDIPDGPPQVLLDGWNDNVVRHNIVNGLMWGPDGWLYGRHGIMGTSFVGTPGATRSQRTPINCGVWRYHPIHEKFEVVAHGTTNPWGMDYDKDGNLFMINTVIGHFWHVVPGARFDRMYGSHFNPYTYETIGQTADHYHWNKDGGEAWHDTKKIGVTKETDKYGGGHAHCGLMFYVDDVWPEQYRNTAFTCNLLGHRINNDRIERKGNGFVAKHNEDFAKTSDTWFRGIELVRSHDHGFYILDWQDTGECHENDGVHRTSGRIFKVNYKETASKAPNLFEKSNEELIKLAFRDRWHFEKAAMLLRTRMAKSNQDRFPLARAMIDAEVRDWEDGSSNLPYLFNLTKMLESDSVDGLGDSIRKSIELAAPHYNGKAPRHIRESVDYFRHLRDGVALKNRVTHNHFSTRTSRLAAVLSSRVRLEIAATLPKLTPQQRMEVARELVQFSEDADDNNQPLLIWYAIEPLVTKRSSEAVDLALLSRIPKVTRFIARRLTEEIDDPAIASQIALLVKKSTGEYTENVLAGIADGLKGRRKVTMPNGWEEAIGKLALSERSKKLANQIGIVFGDGQSLDQVRRIATSSGADPRMRGQAILTLAEYKADGLTELLNNSFGAKEIRRYVIQAYSFCDDPKIAGKLINQFSNLKPDSQSAAINTLTSRPIWAMQLLKAVEKGRIAKANVTAWHARQIENHGDESLSDKLVAVWGAIRKSSTERLAAIDELKALLTKSEMVTVDRVNGQKLFEKSCANCHVLFGSGAKIGPDLTGGNRKDLGYLLENIIDPSSSVAESFRTSIINLVDGRTLTGVILKQTTNVVELQTAEKIITLDRNDVEAIKPTKNSLMPEGLLNELDAKQRRDLIGYLMSN